MELIAFTICSRNFLAYALALRDSFNRHHPDIKFHVALCDSDDGFDAASFPFAVLRLRELGLPDMEGMASRYSVTEFNTAIKPFVFQTLFDRYPDDRALPDPDIYVTSRFEELLESIKAGSECVLTPSITEPAEYAEFDDRQFLRYGAYNLGFCCLADTPSVRRVVWWWARRLEALCIVDLEAGLFVDQKWADLFPAFIERTHALRHPGYNVAYWNLSQRRLERSGRDWTVNGQPLRFFHFSGNVIEDGSVFSRHSTLLDVRNVGPAADLLAEFRRAVIASGHDYFKGIDYAFSWAGDRAENTHTPLAVQDRRRATRHRGPAPSRHGLAVSR